jgi:hypothetical protein
MPGIELGEIGVFGASMEIAQGAMVFWNMAPWRTRSCANP